MCNNRSVMVLLKVVLIWLSISAICKGFYIQPNVIKFTSYPQSTVAVQNSTVTFQCTINKTHLDDSLPNIAIVWIHNGSVTNNCSSTIYYNLQSTIVSHCVIESVQFNDKGRYQCQVIDGADETLCVNLPCIKTVTASRSAYLNVISNTVQTASIHLSSNSSSTLLYCYMLESEQYDVTSGDFEVLWKKDGQYLSNNTNEMFRILHSNNLLVTTNASTVQSALGIYECLIQMTNNSNNSLLVTRVSVLQSQPGISNQVSLSLKLSSCHKYTKNVLVSSRSPFELICLFNGLPSAPHITWTYNNATVGSNDVVFKMEEWLPGNYCCSSGELISCLNLLTQNSQPLYSSTLYPHINTTVLQLDCYSSSLPVQWLYNGYPMNHYTPSLTLTGNWSEQYGIYQCTRLNETIVLYRVLPFGWTNPVTHYRPISFLPPINISLKVEPPSYTGALNNTALLIKVDTFVRELPFIPLDHFEQTLSGPLYQSTNYTESGDYMFHITVVNSLGDSISETIISPEFTSCMLYAPVSPLVTLTCGILSSRLEWTESTLDPYPMFTNKHLTIECFRNNQRVYTNERNWFSIDTADTVTIDAPIGNNGTCNYTMQASIPMCAGSPVSGACYVATPSSVTSTTETSTTEMTTTEMTTTEMTTTYSTVIQSTELIMTTTFTTSSPLIVLTTPRTTYNTTVSTSSVSVSPSSVSESLLSSTSVITLPVLDNGSIAIVASLLGVVLILILLFLLLFVPIVILRLKRTRYIFTSEDIHQNVEKIGFEPFETAIKPSLLYDDTKSITTTYGELDYTISCTDNTSLQETSNNVLTNLENNSSSSLPFITLHIGTRNDSTTPVSDDHSSGTNNSSGNVTLYSSDYLDHFPIDSSSSTPIDTTAPTTPTIIVDTVVLPAEDTSNESGNRKEGSSSLNFLLQVDTSHDKSDLFHTYESMVESVI